MDKFKLAQSSIEFMILVGVVLMIFAAIMTIVAINTSSVSENKVEINAEDVVTTVQKEINLAAQVLDGYQRSFVLPNKILNRNYNITILKNEVIVYVDDEDYWRVIPQVVGNVTKGTNTIQKIGGVIYLN